MMVELNCAADFLCNFLKAKLPREDIDNFHQQFVHVLKQRYQSHWYNETPIRGSAYRSMTCGREHFQKHKSFLDPLLIQIVKTCNIRNIEQYFPENFTLWVDPGEVSYRIGELGSICDYYSKTTGVTPPPRELLDDGPRPSSTRTPVPIVAPGSPQLTEKAAEPVF
ncbi:hypothetical protein CAOG_03747 [Capsaspora owczarzaki ATCC 30864]|uniref:Anti-proliferative protein domain-containing protein n=1 Tax=Capsaspora owczarzaki (strain ATCC 30864) TaxID=595528 RepID=A0A0D2UCS5_CAPO3|nr:hypothetical protein CAOG_03747 [Capsaspora owczarzaki ATCC 30864]KJE92856.1 hypothetical protein CAOG_003747 [Capsaspora owczarzaki ATCC 30864]|eukprot:XP_004363475.1 hypothetical protein CAOG_03747 [Capsaspora owczarzaki ATCC 30864]